MFRLLALLGGGIFLAMLIGGQDRGQLRFGLMDQRDETAIATPVVAAAEVVEAAFVPEKPVMVQPVPEPAAEAPAPGGKIMFVGSASANVREGPGKDHAVVERLNEGEAVLVVQQGEGPDGWSLIRIEGDGVEGYIAARLLTE